MLSSELEVVEKSKISVVLLSTNSEKQYLSGVSKEINVFSNNFKIKTIVFINNGLEKITFFIHHLVKIYPIVKISLQAKCIILIGIKSYRSVC